jgi:tetratricopeptide (TPR) repeat protein
MVVLCLAQGLARAEEGDVDLARQRYKTGQALFQRGRVEDALHEFEEGKASFALPEFDYNIGLCLAKLGRPVEAANALQRYMEARPGDPDAAGIWRMIAELRGEAVKQPSPEPMASPAPVIVAPSPAPLIAPPALRGDSDKRAVLTKAGIGMATVGAALILVSIGTGVGALSARKDYDDSCGAGRCQDDQYDKAHRLANATDFLLPLGVAAVVTSIVLFAVRPKAPPRLAVSF